MLTRLHIAHRLLAFVVAWTPLAATGQSVADELHVVMVGDTDDETLGPSCANDLALLTKVLSEAFSNADSGFQNRWSLTQLSGDEASPAAVLKAIEAVDCGSDDGLFFFYSGHGGLDNTKGHFLAMNRGDLLRSDLRRALLEKTARLTVIITDSCSNTATFEPPARNAPAKWAPFRDLFFRQTGMVDLQSSGKGVFSWGGENGLFSAIFTRHLCEPMTTIDRDGDGRAEWDEFFAAVQQETLDTFIAARDESPEGHEMRTVAPQVPFAFNLPTVSPSPNVILTQPSQGDRDVTDLAFSPDGATILTGDNGGWLRLWDASTGTALRVFENPSQRVEEVSITADGHLGLSNELFRTPAGAAEDKVETVTRVWNLVSGKEERRKQDSLKETWLVRDGQVTRQIRGACQEYHFWTTESDEPESGRLIRLASRMPNRYHQLGFVYDGKTGNLISAERCHKLKNCRIVSTHVTTGRERINRLETDGPPFCAAFSEDGTIIALATTNEYSEDEESGYLNRPRGPWLIEVWDLDKGERIRVFEGMARSSSPHLALSSDGQLLAVGYSGTSGGDDWESYPIAADLRVYDVTAGRERLSIGDRWPGRLLRQVRVLPNRRLAAALGSEVRIYMIP